jgi:hypothetical protein
VLWLLRCPGELAAMEEFNRTTQLVSLTGTDWASEFRPYRVALWLKRLFDLYCFDDPKMKCLRPDKFGDSTSPYHK